MKKHDCLGKQKLACFDALDASVPLVIGLFYARDVLDATTPERGTLLVYARELFNGPH